MPSLPAIAARSLFPPSRLRSRTRQCLAGALFAATLAAQADCIDDAAARHQVRADVLRAIGWQESRLQPGAIGRNADGSVDLGAFQINSVHLPELARYGIDGAALKDGCVCAEVAAWHYRRQIDRLGDGWQAIGAYHSGTSARAAGYANQIATLLMRWKVMPPGALPFPVARTLALPRRTQPSIAPPSTITRPPPLVPGPSAPLGELAYLPSTR